MKFSLLGNNYEIINKFYQKDINPTVLVDHLLKTKKEYNNLKKEEI